MFKFLKDAWVWLDGKKANIGGAMMLIGYELPKFFPELAPISQSIFEVGEYITGGGWLHKGLKATPNETLQKYTLGMVKTRLDPNGRKIGQIPPLDEGGN